MKFMKFLLKSMIVLVILAMVYISCESYMAQFQYKEIKASHILVDTKEDAIMIKERLNNGEVFEDLALERSLCPSKTIGGNLGWINKDKMDKDFTKAAFSMQKGHISDPVQTAYGWHIIRLDDVRKQKSQF